MAMSTEISLAYLIVGNMTELEEIADATFPCLGLDNRAFVGIKYCWPGEKK